MGDPPARQHTPSATTFWPPLFSDSAGEGKMRLQWNGARCDGSFMSAEEVGSEGRVRACREGEQKGNSFFFPQWEGCGENSVAIRIPVRYGGVGSTTEQRQDRCYAARKLTGNPARGKRVDGGKL